MSVGSRIEGLRITKKVNQEELAQYIGVTRATLSRIEKNKFNIDVEKAIKICEYFDVSMEYLYYGDENDKNNEETNTCSKFNKLLKKLNFITGFTSIIIAIITILFFGYYVYKNAILGSKENMTYYVNCFFFFVLLIYSIILLLHIIKYKQKINELKKDSND